MLDCGKIFFQKYKIWGWESPIMKECGGRIGIFSTHYLLWLSEICNFLPLPATFLTHDAAATAGAIPITD